MSVTGTNYDDRVVVGGTSTEPNPYTLQEGKTYTAAQYEGSGGAVYVEADGTVTGKNVTFKDNCVTDSKGKGGAICNGSGAVLNLISAAFSGNNTTGLKGQGGAIYNGGTATVTSTTFSSNRATMGGAVFNNGGTLKVSGGTFSSNSAKYGGAIQNFGGGTMSITGASFSGNSAGADGGAIAHNAGSATITGTTFSSNTARSSGGAIYNTNKLTLADVTFSGNSAKYGGAIYNTDSGTITMTGTVTLATESDEFCNTGTLNWDLTGGTASCGSIAGYQYLNNDGGTLTITVGSGQKTGSFIIAAGNLTGLDGKNTFTLTGLEGQSTIVINGESVAYNDRKYTLATDSSGTKEDPADDKLVLTVESLNPSIADASVTVNGRYTYNGEAQNAAVTVVLDGTTLVKDTDYTLTYTNNVNAGTATVTVTGIGTYTGTKNAAFTISRKSLTVTGTTADGKTYDGTTKAEIGTIGTISGAVDGDDVVISTAEGVFDDKNAGNGIDVQITYTLTGKDASNYSAASGVTCADIEKRSVTLTSADASKEYDGKPLTDDTVTVSGDGWADGEGAEYTVTGSQTDVGSSANTFTYTLNTGTMSGNYNIRTVEGVLSVTPAGGDTPQVRECVTEGITTVVSWVPSSQSEFTDTALSTEGSPDEKLLVRTDDTAIEFYAAPENYDLSLKGAGSGKWNEPTRIPCTAAEKATAVVSNENDIAELFFVNVAGTWNSMYQAQHTGFILDWKGTDECVDLAGKNRIADTFTGSSDANILYLTDDVNGDALFVDDIYTEFPDEQQSRISQIDEIRAGAGDDIADMTSQRFEYTGDGLTIRGGSGNDTIWSNKGSNQLFGDAGDDRIVGGSGNDVIAGGSGNDSMHGGGGNDIFCFCLDWGEDTVEQLSGGSATLWFASGSEDNWDQETMTYTDGGNSVKVTGISNVTLKFGSDETAQYASLVSAGAFMEESSDKIFEKEQKGVLATV